MVDKNLGVDRNSVKLVDESSVVVENTGLKLEGLDEKAVVYQRLFSPLCTVDKSKVGISQNFVAFSEYTNFPSSDCTFFLG